MNIAEFSIRNKVSTLVITAVLLVGGMMAYQKLGRLEDPEFTIKEALVVTAYPGATAQEVELEVTEVIERAVQQLGQLDEVKSQSQKGLSTVTAVIKDKYDKATLPQVWDELRRKVSDAQSKLPPGAGPSQVMDDYGDVYGVFFALTGDGYSYRDLKDYADFLQRELLLCQDVAKIDLSGVQSEAVYIEMSREKMARFGISKESIYQTLAGKNLVADAGNIRVGDEYLQLRPTGEFQDIAQFGDLLIGAADQAGQRRLVYLKDVATITRGYIDPPTMKLRVNGLPAIGVAISTVSGGNVVTMGNAIAARLRELQPTMPFGMKLHRISIQSEAVSTAINGFVVSLIEAVVIVIVVLMLFMGLRSGVLIGAVLLITIVGTFMFMKMKGIMLERISLGALIIALGMLVDNAIVVTDGILVRLQAGEDRLEAAKKVVAQNMMPLLGATVVAVIAFAAIGTSQDSTGEYCRSLFQVILLSLMFSWVTAVTITPLLCVMFLKGPAGDQGEPQDPYGGQFYTHYRGVLNWCIRRRWLTMGVMGGLLVLSIVGFGAVEQSFFPDSTRPQFMVDVWLPEGSYFERTEAVSQEVEKYLSGLEHVTSVTTLVGRGAPRFLLTYAPEKLNSAYCFFMVDVDDYKVIAQLGPAIQAHLEAAFPQTIPIVYKFMLGPGEATKIQARFSGPQPAVLRSLADQAVQIMQDDGEMIGVQSDWRGMVKALRPVLNETAARNNGIERPEVAAVLQEAFDGHTVGVYRERDELLPIKSRLPLAERSSAEQIDNLLIWSKAADRMIPLKQVIQGQETVFDNSVIMRRDRIRTITAKCNPRHGLASDALARIKDKIEAIPLPEGYKMEWGGEYESSKDAQAALFSKIPVFVVLMILIVIFLFNSLRQPGIIWLCVPLAIVGVTAGLLLTGQPFGFMALLGLLSLSGMLIKNAIVLIDQIDLEIREGKAPLQAVIESGVSRMRPVMMAAATTVLGLVPLLMDAFFVSMAVTIMAGLTFASILTLVVVPVLYTMFFKIRP